MNIITFAQTGYVFSNSMNQGVSSVKYPIKEPGRESMPI